MDRPGLLVIDKPAGLTSHQVVARVRRVFQTRKVGHAGTLDPMATGVLIIGLNRATRLLGHLALHDKAYRATIRLGAATSTDDAEGQLVGGADASGLDRSQVEAAMSSLRGAIMQRPSSVSAIKVDGKRAYALTRAGQDVQLPERSVTVSRFQLTDLAPAGPHLDAQVEVECSSGTYVRALARDLGAALGVGGHLTMLRRTRIGQYTLANALELHALTAATPLMTMAAAAARSFPCIQVDADAARDVSYGRPLPVPVPAGITGVIGPAGDLLALYRPEQDGSRPIAVFC